MDSGFRSLSPEVPPRKIGPSISETRERVNHHLQMTHKSLEIRQSQVNQLNPYLAPRLGDRLHERADFPKALGAPMDPDRAEHNAPQDLKKKVLLNFQEASPTVSGQIRDREDQEIFQEELRRAWLEQFIQNARKNGYEVRVNENLVVTGVRRLPKTQNHLSREGASGSQ